MTEILDHIPVGIIAVDNDLRIGYINAAICETFSQKSDELLGQVLWDAFPGLRGSIFEETYAEVKEAGTPVDFGAPYAPLRLWLEIHAAPSAYGMTIAITNISQEKRLEESRRISEATLNAFLDASPDAAILLDRDGEVLAANQAIIKRMNTTNHALIGSNGYSMLPYKLAASLRKRNVQDIIEHKPQTFEEFSQDRYYEITVVPVKNEQGILSRLAIFSRDITEQKKYETDLEAAFATAEEERNRLAAVMEALPIGVVITDEKGGIISSNDMDEKIWGIRPPTNSVADYAEYKAWWIEDNRPVLPAEWASAITIQTGEVVMGQMIKIQRFDGSTGIILNSSAPIKNNSGGIVGCAVAIEDISALHFTQETLKHERALLMTIIKNLPVPLAILTPQGEVFNGNESFRSLLQNHNLNDINDVNFLHPFSKSPVPWAETPLANALHGETVDPQELLLAAPGAEETPIILSATPVIINDQIAAVVAIFQDISLLKELDNEKDQFLTVLSHELQTPLTSILGYTDLAIVNDTLEMYRKTIPVIQRNSKRQALLVNELLDMSKLLQGRPDCTPAVIDLCQLAENATEKVRSAAIDAGLEITFFPPPQELPVFVDAERIAICIDHLLTNSIKFSPAGGKVTITCQALQQTAQLTITDSGRGIDPELLDTLFHPFHQLSRDEAAGGLGLGLAIVHGYIKWHGGTITASSKGIGQGSSFIITLPINSPATQSLINKRLLPQVRG